jgi:hypothetical protein
MDAWVESLDSMEPDVRLVAVAHAAGQKVEIPCAESNEALRRALVVRAVGGSPVRDLELGEEAVARLAAELDDADRRRALRAGLDSLRAALETRPAGAASLDALLADDDLAWRCFAAGRLAQELAG